MRVLALLALLLVAPASAATGSGLRGVVTRGPTSPVCRVDTPCSAPAANVKLTFVRRGVAKSVKSDQLGRYRIALAPGTYDLRIDVGRFAYEPHRVVVPVGRYAVRPVYIDTGVR